MSDGTPEPGGVDVARLMSRIQGEVSLRGAQLARQLEQVEREMERLGQQNLAALARCQAAANDMLDEIRAETDKLASADMASIVASQGRANDQMAEIEREARAASGAAGISFHDLAGVPGAARPWTSPKRWVAALYRLVWRRQEAFNAEVVRRLEAERCRREGVYRLAVSLLETMNMLVTRIEMERTLRTRAQSMSIQMLGSLNALARRELEDARERLLSEGTLAAALRETVGELVAASRSIEPPSVAPGDSALRDALEELRTRIVEGVAGQTRQLAALAARVGAMERAAEKLRAGAASAAPRERRVPVATGSPPPGVATPDFDFLAFEALTRGGEESITAGQRQYLTWFDGADNVLDAGCGRGEFLELLRGAGVDARGIDSDPRMVEHCRAKGLRVEQATLFEHLSSAPDASLGGIFLGQVVEHLSPAELAALAPLALRKLKPGAAFIAETINPMCLTTFSGAFYADPTHVRPVHPKALEHFLRSAGFDAPEIILSAPVPETDRLAPLRESEPLEPRVKDLVIQANANIQRLNALLYSFGNYALAARKPAA